MDIVTAEDGDLMILYDFNSKNLDKSYTGFRGGFVRITTKQDDGICFVKFFRTLDTQHECITIDLGLNVIGSTLDIKDYTLERLKVFIQVNRVKLLNYWDSGIYWKEKDSEEFFKALKVPSVFFEKFVHRYPTTLGEIDFEFCNLDSSLTGIKGVFIAITSKNIEKDTFIIKCRDKLKSKKFIVIDSNSNIIMNDTDFDIAMINKLRKFVQIQNVRLQHFWEYGIQWHPEPMDEFLESLKISKIEQKE